MRWLEYYKVTLHARLWLYFASTQEKSYSVGVTSIRYLGSMFSQDAERTQRLPTYFHKSTVYYEK